MLLSGGGNVDNLDVDRFGPPLRWMLYEAINAGLHSKPFQTAKWADAEHTPSMTGIWKVFEYIPIKRLSYKRTHDGGHTETW